jgi:hypothetical protein
MRNLLEILILHVFSDKQYFKNNAIRALIRELLVTKGFFSALILSEKLL